MSIGARGVGKRKMEMERYQVQKSPVVHDTVFIVFPKTRDVTKTF